MAAQGDRVGGALRERGGTLAALPVAATDGRPEVEMALHDGTPPTAGDESAAQRPGSDVTSTLSADAYTRERALPELKKAQLQAPRISRQLKALQLLVIIGAAVRPPPPRPRAPPLLPALCPRVSPVPCPNLSPRRAASWLTFPGRS